MGKIDSRYSMKSALLNMAFNLLFAVLTLAVILVFGNESIIACILLAILFGIGMIKWRSRATLITALFGLIAGTISEMVLTARGVWEYNYIDFFGVPVYLFFIWGNAAAFIYQSGFEVKKLFRENDKHGINEKSSVKYILFPVLTCVVSFLSIILLYTYPWLLFGFNAVLSIAALILWKSQTTAVVFIFSAVLEVYSEILAINCGLWTYYRAGVLIIPLWLVVVWGCVGACLYRLGRVIDKKSEPLIL